MTVSSATLVVVPDLLWDMWAREGSRCLAPSSEPEETSAGNGCSSLKHMESLYFPPKETDELVQKAGLWIQGVLSQLLKSCGEELVPKAADT